ncbi:MAG: ATP-binding protein [Bacillota bacterium]
MRNREEMITFLTGVQSSKRNYYTELKKTVSELQKKNTQLEIINDVMKGFNIEMSMDDMLGNVFEKLQTIFSIHQISLSVVEGRNLVRTNVFPSPAENFIPLGPIPDKNSLYWHVVRSGKPLFYRTSDKHTWSENESLIRIGLKSLFLFPLINKGKVFGLLAIGSKTMDEHTPSDLTFFQQLSDQVAVCMENARLYNEVLVTKKHWEETFQAVSEAIFTVGVDGSILQANLAAYQYFPEHNKLSGRQVEELLFLKEDNPFRTSMITKAPSTAEIHLCDKVCECYSYPVFDDADHLYAGIIYIKDVTAKRKIEAQLIQSGKLAAIGEMAAGVAHELNNPLTAVMGNAQLLLRKLDLSDPQHKLLENIYECGKRSKTIIRNLLTFSRQEEVLFEQCSMNEAVQQVLGLVGNQLRKMMIDIETDLDDSLPFIEGSNQQIGQIILNLLLNAKDALEDSDKSNKKIHIHTGRETIEGVQSVVLTVTDNGTGMEEALVADIFHPFFTTKNAVKGTGLGLSVSLGIAEAHGGTLKAESTLGCGSSFKLILPIPSSINLSSLSLR